jgi:hypothetical protein
LSRIIAFLIIGFSLLLTACRDLSGEPSPVPDEAHSPSWEPVAGDDKLIRGEVTISEKELQVQENEPDQYVLFLSGTLPTPCHQLRVTISEPDEKNQIDVDIYSVVDPAEICIQVLEPFEANIPLGSYPSGEYSVFVNGQSVGEITF